MFCTVTVTTAPPVAPGVDAAVAMLFTYFVPEPALTSQPQLLARTVVPEAADWIASVMVVRQEDAARITSDILARLV